MIKTVTDLNGNKHQIDIDKDLEWLAPFLSEAKRAGCPVWRIDRIVGYYVPEGKVEAQHAALNKQGNSKGVMSILKKRQSYTGRDGIIMFDGYTDADKGSNYEFTLNSLAHELSHLTHWDHDADRFIEEARLFYRFAKLAKRRGYKGYKG